MLDKHCWVDVFSMVCEIQELREKMDRQYSKGKPISLDTVALQDAATLLKLFLRELPEPLLTSERVNAFIQVDSNCTFLLAFIHIFLDFFTVVIVLAEEKFLCYCMHIWFMV